MKLHHITFYTSSYSIFYYMNVLVEYGVTAVTAELLRSRDEEPGQNTDKRRRKNKKNRIKHLLI